ncbi:MAG: RraA family protein [Pseudomonadota bacterium]
MDSHVIDFLRKYDTPTVCNAIEVAQGQRGFANFTKQTLLASSLDGLPMVGFARTAKIAGQAPSSDDTDVVADRRLAYFKHMSEGPKPSVCVVEDLDYPDTIAAWWGELHTAIHKGFGMAGVVTNGLMRDLDQMVPGFPVLSGAIGPSHYFVHVEEFGTEVSVFGMSVKDGDLIHADQHGALVIPADVTHRLTDAIDTLLRNESIVLDAVAKPDFDYAKLEQVWSKFEKART